jgi:hypothetical protein
MKDILKTELLESVINGEAKLIDKSYCTSESDVHTYEYKGTRFDIEFWHGEPSDAKYIHVLGQKTKVLVITSYDDYAHNAGSPTALIAMEYGDDEDAMYCQWYREKNRCPEKTNEEIMGESIDGWWTMEVQTREKETV